MTNYAVYLQIPDLIEGNEYQFRVSAENKVGVGPPSEPSKPVMAKDPWGKCMTNTNIAWNITVVVISSLLTEKPGKPDPPEILTMKKNSIELKWKPPFDDGGAPITSYQVCHQGSLLVLWCTPGGTRCQDSLSYVKVHIYAYRLSTE